MNRRTFFKFLTYIPLIKSIPAVKRISGAHYDLLIFDDPHHDHVEPMPKEMFDKLFGRIEILKRQNYTDVVYPRFHHSRLIPKDT